jgi:uncharacterized protein with ParB-like and HNH nuclease domain
MLDLQCEQRSILDLPCRKVDNSNVLLLIPGYQRPYVWHEDRIRDILDDLWRAADADNVDYFLGSIVLSRIGLNRNVYELEVVDGQQRLTTVSIIARRHIPLPQNLHRTQHTMNIMTSAGSLWSRWNCPAVEVPFSALPQGSRPRGV